MKVYLILILLVWLGPQAINALAKRSGYEIANCSLYEDGDVLADILGCSSYYLCVGGNALRQFCARGLYFDAEVGVCNKASLVDCVIIEEPITAAPNATAVPHANATSSDTTKTCTTTTPCTTAKPCTTTRSCSITTTCSTTRSCSLTTPCTTTKSCSTTTCSTTTCSTTTCSSTTCSSTTCSTTTCSTTTCSSTTCSTTQPCSATASPITENLVVTITSKPTQKTTTKIPQTLQFLTSNDDCATLAEGTKLYNLIHCRRYYVCTNKRVKRITCPLGQWFDRATQTCRPRSEVTNCATGRN